MTTRPNRFGGRNLILLISLFCLVVLHPVFRTEWLARLTLDAGLTIIALAGINAVSDRRYAWVLSAVLALPALAGRWLSHVVAHSDLLTITALLCFALFLLFNSCCVLADVLRQRTVTANTIYGAVSVYILIGVMFAAVFMALEVLQPGSFDLDPPRGGTADSVGTQLLAFSFVTLTTVGYGNITPATPEAGALCNVEAILGQMYIAVLVARLVGIQVAQARSSDPRPPG